MDITRAYGLEFLFPEKDKVIGQALRVYGEFARPQLDLIGELLSACAEPGTYVDIGANIGAIALPLAARFPVWKVVAVEAHRGLAGVLAANVLNNRLYNVDVFNAAAGRGSGLARFPALPLSGEGNFGVMSLANPHGLSTEIVRVCSIDEIAPADTRLIKVDVEGAEAEVLRGAATTLRDVRPAWIVETRAQPDEAARFCMRTLSDAGCRLFWFPAPLVLQRPLKGPAQARHGFLDLNLLALPPGMTTDWDLLPVDGPDAPWPDLNEAFRYRQRYDAPP